MTARAVRRADPRPRQASRRQAREMALQMLYQWEIGRLSMLEIRQAFWDSADRPAPEEVRAFALGLADGVVAHVQELDPIIVDAADNWRLERMNVVDRLVLRLATYELLHELGTPARVVINEALELARTFSGDDAVRFVNGVLDAIRRTLQRE